MMNKARVSSIVYAVLWILSLIITASHGALDTGSLFFYLCAGIAALYLLKNRQSVLYGGNKQRRRIIEWITAVYFTFALLGRSFFMKEAGFDLSVLNIAGFIIAVTSLFPITPGILSVFERLSEKQGLNEPGSDNRIGRIKAGLICGLIVFGIDILLNLSYYPCTMTPDSVTHWRQATGAAAMSDYSPIAFNLLLKGLFSLTGFSTPFIYVVFQTVVLSAIIGDTAAFFYRRGVGIRKLIIGSVVFAIIPSTFMLPLYLSKNPLTGILCLGMAAALLQAITEPEYYLAKPLWHIKTAVLISGVYLTRENNVVIIIPLICFSVWFVFSHKEIGRRILIAAGGTAFVIILMTQGVYRLTEYEHADKSHETVRPLLAPVGSAIQQGLSLPDDIVKTAEKVLPAEEWAERYNPYNSDPVTWHNPKPKYKDISLREAFRVYFRMLRIYPGVVIRDRLDGMNCVWDIRADMTRCPVGLREGVSFEEAKLPDGIIGDTMGSVKSFAASLLEISKKEQIMDIFIWKNGIYVYLLLVTAVFLFRKKRPQLLWAAMPSVFILLTYVLVIAWQMYFYIWFFPLSTVMLMIVSIIECSRSKTVTGVPPERT